jgi:KipI family sensor histidine kinase inhibitor
MNRPIHQFTFNKLCETVAAIMYQHGPEILPLGPDGVLIRFSETLDEPANRAALAFGEKLKSKSPEGVIEIATSLVSVFVRFQPNVIRRKALGQFLRRHLEGVDWSNVDLPQGRTLWRIPATFGGEHGPQLEDVANAAGLNPDAAVAELCASDLRVLALGFAPGQPYLGFMGENWNIPRQTEVTPEVPQGAIVVAVRQVIPFANASPTGWRQIGRTAFRCYDPDRKVPLPLSAGDLVRFEAINAKKFATLLKDPNHLGGAVCEPIE